MILAAILSLLLQIETLPPAQAEERLIAWAIADFEKHPPGLARGFRAVHAASLEHPEDAVRPLLCGEIQVESASGSTSWVDFATLETRSGYEQWLGGTAGTWCNQGTRLDLSRDLSGRFQDALVRKK